LEELNHKYESLVAASLHEKTIFEFIEYHQLQNIIEGLNKKLPTNIKVMNQPSDSISIEIDDNQMKVHGYLNLMEINKFNLILATSVPHKIGNGKFSAISTDHQLLAVNYNTQEYFLLTTKELSECITIKAMAYLCAPAAVYNIEEHENCIIDALFQRKDDHSCPQREFSVENLLWKKLAMQNTWLVIANKSTNGAITCNGIRKDIRLKDTVLIKINDECTLRTKGTMLRGERRSSIAVKSTFLKSVEPPVNTNFTTEKRAYAPIEPMLNIADSFFDVTEEPEMPSLHKVHLVTQHAISASATIVFIIGLYIIWKTWKNRCKRKSILYQVKGTSAYKADIELQDVRTPPTKPRRVWPTIEEHQSSSTAAREHV
jgi:Baculovirus F protein